MNTRPIRLLLVAGCCFAPPGCSTSNNRHAALDRDPLVMSHLTHRKDDPAFAETDSDIGKDDESTVRPAALSKSNKPGKAELAPAVYQGPSRGRAGDYSWLRGGARYHRDDGAEPGWYLHYGRTEKDRFEGKLRLASSPRLALLREGDELLISGRLLDENGRNPQYHVESIALAD